MMRHDWMHNIFQYLLMQAFLRTIENSIAWFCKKFNLRSNNFLDVLQRNYPTAAH